MQRYIDLHMHTCFSDGTCTPEEILEKVKSNNICVFSITDHDTLEGYRKTKELLGENDPKLITGIELSVSIDDRDMHILAYFIEPDYRPLNDTLDGFKLHRNQRGRLIVDKLIELDVDITFDDVFQQANGAVIGRPHIAMAMLRKKAIGYYEEAFGKYIGFNGPAYVPKTNFKPQEAINLIHNAGGLAVLAHPGIDNKESYIENLAGMGLDGVEVYHPAHSQSVVNRFKHIAERFRLLITGGSDFHGIENRYGKIGSQKVPYTCFEELIARTREK
ncbi:MAG: PHP domain-containing protein [Candidatus Zixiibacteriota bacterium]